MNPLFILKSLVVVVPAIIGLLKWKKADPDFRPIIILMWVALFNQLLGVVIIKKFHSSNAIPYNIYSLVESLLIFIQFNKWDIFKRKKQFFTALVGIMTIFWLIEMFVFNGLKTFSPFYRVSYAFVIVLLSVTQINYLIIHDSRNLFRNSRFLICVGFIIFFIYQMLYEGALNINPTNAPNNQTSNTIIELFANVDAFVNLIYALGLYFIPKREELPFTLGRFE